MLGKKIGMLQIFDKTGEVVGVTAIEVGPCIVTQIKTVEKDGYSAVQLSLGKKKREFEISNPAEYKVGQELKVDVFKAGDELKISGTTIGKGFAGRIKRWHSHRGPMSHGSKFHRIMGSIGSGSTPGRVWKGKPMPGRMGNVKVTLKNVQIVDVLPEKNLLLIKGSVPGKRGNLVLLRKNA